MVSLAQPWAYGRGLFPITAPAPVRQTALRRHSGTLSKQCPAQKQHTSVHCSPSIFGEPKTRQGMILQHITVCVINVPRPFSTTVIRENNCLPLPPLNAHFSKRRPKGVHRTLPEKEDAFSIAQDRNLSFLYGSSPATGNRIRAKGVLGCSSRESRGRPRKEGRRTRASQ